MTQEATPPANADGPKVEVDEISEEESDEVFDDEEKSLTSQERILKTLAEKTVEGVPDWASLPPNFTIPLGKRCGWMLFRAEWTDAPAKGDRWCMMWPLSEAEEKNAYKRSQGDPNRAVAELAKQTIRVIDSIVADRTGKTSPGNVNIFWAEIGTRCRQMVQNFYLKTHTLSQEEQTDFFANCFVVTTAVVG